MSKPWAPISQQNYRTLIPGASLLPRAELEVWPRCWCGHNVKADKRGDPTRYCSNSHRARVARRKRDGRILHINYVQFNTGRKSQQTLREWRRLVRYQRAMAAHTL